MSIKNLINNLKRLSEIELPKEAIEQKIKPNKKAIIIKLKDETEEILKQYE